MSDAINITEIQQQISASLSDGSVAVPGVSQEVIDRFLESKSLDDYIKSKTYHWVIRTYLVNALLQGHLSDERFQEYMKQAETDAGCEQLAVSILFSSLQKAGNLANYQPTEIRF